VDSIDDYAGDVDGVVKIAKAANPGKKLFLFGHSAGGVTAVVYTLEHQSELAGLIAESFAYQTPAPDFAIAALKGLSHLAPHAHVLRLDNKIFSRDSTAVDAMNADALILHETQPTKTIAALARADDRLTKEFGTITLPVLILHGTADKATKPSGSQVFYDKAASKDKTLKLYEGHYHDMLNDIGKEQVLADIQAWIATRV
jgi:alpha-beta hydrolase superfamily lysophospholipase